MQEWPSQGGWKQVVQKPAEATAHVDVEPEENQTPKRRVKHG